MIARTDQTKIQKAETFPSAQSTIAVPRRQVKNRRATINRKREPDVISVTTHFSGFQFKHQSDMEWLGLQNNKVNIFIIVALTL
jgi:hypothetical protein